MPFRTSLTERLGVAHPIFLAPMAGGAGTPELVAAVAEAGGFGSLGAAYSTPAQITEMARAVRARTNRPYGLNLFSPLPTPDAARAGAAAARVAKYHEELGLPPPTPPEAAADPFAIQFPAVLESGAAVFSFTFGIPPAEAISAAKSHGKLVTGTATTVEEAKALEAAGVDAIVAQGAEAGAHRGTFGTSFEAAMIGTVALVPSIVDAVRVPVIASGGIMDGRGIAAALALGASAVQLGTAFLTCDECGIPECYKAAILNAREDETRLTRAFSGRHARGIANRFMDEVEAGGEILDFPLQNSLTRPLRNAAGKAGRPEFLSLWAGQGLRMARREPAAALMAHLVKEAEEAIGRLIDRKG